MTRFLVCVREKETKIEGTEERQTIKIRASKLSISFPTYEPRLVGSLLHYFLSLSSLIVLSNCSKHPIVSQGLKISQKKA